MGKFRPKRPPKKQQRQVREKTFTKPAAAHSGDKAG